MSWIWMNVPLCVFAVAFTVGLPAWLIWKHPDEGDPRAAQAAAKRSQERTAAAAHQAHHGSVRELHPIARGGH
jgi:hypothetical protein